MILRYWSALTMFRKMPVKAVPATMDAVPFTIRIMACMMLSTIRVAVMAAPKIVAHRISQIVPNMPDMPRVATNSSSSGAPVSIPVLPYINIMAPLKRRAMPSNSSPAIWSSNSPCTHTATPIPISTAVNSTAMAGFLRRIIMKVSTGTNKSQGDSRKVLSSASCTIAICCTSAWGCISPLTVKISNVTNIVGTVVYII